MKTVPVETMREDWDWQHAFHEAICDGDGKMDLSCVAEVIAADEGSNDGPDWIAVVRLDGTIWSENQLPFCVMRAGCDYTGWDCQAGGKIEYYATREEALSRNTLTENECKRLGITIESKPNEQQQ